MNWKRGLISITGIVVIGLVGYWAYKWFTESKAVPGILQASGTVEGNEVMLSSEVSGQVTDVKIKEGDLVKKGQLLLTVDDSDLKVKLEQAKDQVDLTEVQMQQALSQIDAMQWNVKQANLGSNYTNTEVAQKQKQAETALDIAKTGLKQAQVQSNQANTDYVRIKQLYEQNAVSKQDLDHAETAFKQAETVYESAKLQVESAQAALDLVKAGDLQAESTQASAQGVSEQLAVVKNQYQAAVVQKNLAVDNVKAVQLALDKTDIKSPMNGIVVDELVKEGETVTPGTPVFRLQDNREMTADVYITEKDLGEVKVGDEVRIFSDSFPDQYATGKISWIDTEAQFTPKNVHLQDERERLVYKVKVRFDNTKGWFKTGMPVDVKIRFESNAKWQ